MGRLVRKFLGYTLLWRQAGDCVALLDALMSLRSFSIAESARGPVCLPHFTPDGESKHLCEASLRDFVVECCYDSVPLSVYHW